MKQPAFVSPLSLAAASVVVAAAVDIVVSFVSLALVELASVELKGSKRIPQLAKQFEGENKSGEQLEISATRYNPQ